MLSMLSCNEDTENITSVIDIIDCDTRENPDLLN